MPAKEYANKPYFTESSANERMVRGYPSPKYYDLFLDYITANEMKMSPAISLILREFFDKMPEDEKARIRILAEKFRSESQKKTA